MYYNTFLPTVRCQPPHSSKILAMLSTVVSFNIKDWNTSCERTNVFTAPSAAFVLEKVIDNVHTREYLKSWKSTIKVTIKELSDV